MILSSHRCVSGPKLRRLWAFAVKLRPAIFWCAAMIILPRVLRRLLPDMYTRNIQITIRLLLKKTSEDEETIKSISVCRDTLVLDLKREACLEDHGT